MTSSASAKPRNARGSGAAGHGSSLDDRHLAHGGTPDHKKHAKVVDAGLALASR
jgi:hypothetical protein